MQALERDRRRAAGEPAGVDDVGDGPDGRVLALVARHEQDLPLVADVERQRHRHVREDDGVVQRDEQELLHLTIHSPQ